MAINYLKERGYSPPETAWSIIRACDDWYRAHVLDVHRRVTINDVHYTVPPMGFGRRVAADDANLCEVIEINAGGESNQAQYDFVRELLKANRFDTQYRRQLELVAAEGTAAAYVWLDGGTLYDDGTIKGGRLRLNYVDALGFIPLTVNDGEVTEAAFVGTDRVRGKEILTLMLCTRDENGQYGYEIRMWNEHNEPIPGGASNVVLGNVKPFAVLRTARVNTFEEMPGFGYPKLHDVIPILQALDFAFCGLMGDIDTAEKITLINEQLCKFDDQGKPITPNEQMKRRFVSLGEKLPDQKDLIHEIIPEIRVEKFRDTIELLLGLLSQQFGFGSKKYSFDQTGALVTATQYIGERQDMMQELNRQRQEAKEYITGIVRALLWFANTYQGGGWDVNAEVLVDFDDSVITSEADELEQMRNDVIAGIGGAYVRQQYLMRRYNLDEEEALKWATNEDADASSETED